jgi:endonuclease/exonuclease/phosphatase family metal-dependent hydrolase
MKKLFLLLVLAASSVFTKAQDTITITTWNIEHLGSSGRGLGGIGKGNLPLRKSDDFKAIASLIKTSLQSDIIALQEIALSDTTNGRESDQLDSLVKYLGSDWKYVLGTRGAGDILGSQVHNMQNAFLWNSSKVHLIESFTMDFENIKIGKNAFDRHPLVGYFEAIKKGEENQTDFLLVNVHLKSGQNNDENHLGAMVIIEQNLKDYLKDHGIKESDKVILGDFNDNPYDERYFDLLYRYMEHRKYVDLVTEDLGATRMDDDLKSIIDHVLVNSSFKNEMVEVKAKRYFPTSDLAEWRKIYSDHFPISIEVKVRKDGDVD